MTIFLIQSNPSTQIINDKILSALFISFGYLLGRIYTSSSGGVLNPGVSFGLIIFDCIRNNDYRKIKFLWIIIIAPIIGAIFALIFYENIYIPKITVQRFYRLALIEKEKNENKEKTF